MTLKKIFIYFSLLPIIIGLFDESIINLFGLRVEFSTITSLRIFLLVVSILGTLFIIYQNFFQKINNTAWYVLSILIIIMDVYLIYAIYSLSNFGF